MFCWPQWNVFTFDIPKIKWKKSLSWRMKRVRVCYRSCMFFGLWWWILFSFCASEFQIGIILVRPCAPSFHLGNSLTWFHNQLTAFILYHTNRLSTRLSIDHWRSSLSVDLTASTQQSYICNLKKSALFIIPRHSIERKHSLYYWTLLLCHVFHCSSSENFIAFSSRCFVFFSSTHECMSKPKK